MLDSDLAKLYKVSTKRLNEQVKRNISRFPGDFVLLLTRQEVAILRSQIATLAGSLPAHETTRTKIGKHKKYLPYAFTERGVAMLSSVLNSERAIQVNIAIMRTFIKLRQILPVNAEIARKLSELEGKVGKHSGEIEMIFQAIRELMTPFPEPPPEPPKPRIGFHP